MKQLLRQIFLSAFTLLCLITAGCSTITEDQFNGQSAQMIYTQGQAYLENEDYSDAIIAFQALNAQYPFSPEAKKGNLGLIYAYFQHGDPALSLAIASRFLRTYPSDTDAAYAYYMMGVVEFNNGRGFLEEHFPYSMSDHDAANYRAAYKNFQAVVQQFPHSRYASDAKRRMIYLLNIMAMYQVKVGEFDFAKHAYVAAAQRGLNVLIHYPQSPVVEPALELMLRSYEKLNLSQLAYQTAQMLALNFPENETAKSFLKAYAGQKNLPAQRNANSLKTLMDVAQQLKDEQSTRQANSKASTPNTTSADEPAQAPPTLRRNITHGS